MVAPSVSTGNPITKAHNSSYQIGQMTISDKDYCSGTAIGPQAILTATHCELPSEILYIRGLDAAPIVARIRDGQDHTIFLLSGVQFPDYVDVSLKDPLEQSEDVFTFGNPGELRDIYQKGYIAGVRKDTSLAADLGLGDPSAILFSVQAYSGESGAGIFNTFGQLIAVLSIDQEQDNKGGERISFAGAFPLAFSQSDLDKAREFHK